MIRTIAIPRQTRPPHVKLVIVPAEPGYRTSGFYARERPNEKRFVISPNTLLVYEVERLQ